jgi:asparagine synthase (glutamine-hydrolysing)
MCGIAGVLAYEAPTGEMRHRVDRMTATLTHRGPDDHGIADGPGWAIGMRRLAIQDTSLAGHQPMRLGGRSLVFNGEVYNFRELRQALEPQGYRFSSGCDTEVVLAALDHWGPAALTRFNGMFALVMVDEQRRRALVARDRFGKKPLFLARLRDGWAFASELKAIIDLARAELSIDEDSLAEFFRLQYVPTPRSIFRQVTKVPAASWFEIDLDTGHAGDAERFWSLPEALEGDQASPEEVLDTVRSAVRRRLVADVPVGAFLSGGTDSSLVVSCMRDLQADVRTFSIGFADPRFDESAYAAAVAERLGTSHIERRLEWQDAMDLVQLLAVSFDEPFADSSAIPTLAVSALARKHVTVALSGDGGDEFFGGYTRYRVRRALRVAQRAPGRSAQLLTRLPPRGRLSRRARLFGELAAMGDERAVYRELISVWRSRELRRLMPGAADGDGFCPGYYGPAGSVERMMRCDARTYLVDDIMQKVDRASMASSLEARAPLLDPDVISVALRSTAAAERSPGAKPLLRDALRLQLPDTLVDRPKMGFGMPVGEWMRDGLRPLLEDLVLARRDAEYDVATAHAVCREHLSGARDAAPQAWSLLVYELWRRTWLEGG